MSDDEECRQQGTPVFGQSRMWRFSAWDILGIASVTVANALVAVANGLAMVSQEFSASANRSRVNADARDRAREAAAARREIGADLQRLIDEEDS